MKHTAAGALTGAIVALAGVGIASPAHADERRCTGRIGAVTVSMDVVVPSGATCTLEGTRVKGNIEIRGNAKLTASRIRVDGNIQSQGHRWVSVVDSRVDGSIQLKDGGLVNLRRNDVNSDVQLFSNTKTGTKYVYRNVIDGNLQCKSNSPRPTGGQNVVHGNKEDQRRSL